MRFLILNPTCYPLRIRVNAGLLDDFIGCEDPSYEDYVGLLESGEPEDAEEAADMICGTQHGVEILRRHKGLIELHTADEVADIYYRLCSGTIGCSERGKRWANRIADKLRPILQEPRYGDDYADLIRMWRAQGGY